MTIEQAPKVNPVNCRPGETVAVAGDYYCAMCTQVGPIGHVSLSRGVHDRPVTRKRFAVGDRFDSSCPEHGAATGWTLEGAYPVTELGEALFTAVECGDPDIVYALIDKGADVNARKDDGRTALMLAASAGCPDVVQVLLDRGADVNARHLDGTTALMVAAVRGHPGVLRLLLESGADVNAKKNDSGTTPLEIAASGGHIDMVRALIDWGANVDALNFSGRTALVCAGLNGHTEVVAFLKSLKG